jgi:hypothetical protein
VEAIPMIQTLGTTTNFIIQYQDTYPNAKQRAQAIKANCESEFATLRSLFQNTKGFGATNRVTLQVEKASLASNNGYHSDGSTKIVMNPFDELGTSTVADDAVLSLYIAEIIEVLMTCRNVQTGKTTWHANQSEGEGLSRLAAGTFHPDGYYQVLGGPFVNQWLQTNDRHDWLTTPENTDTDVYSHGCSLLFLYYLRDQLGYSLFDIITKAGASLEETYHALTGNSGAYANFTSFLLPYFPIGKTPSLKTDDPFPILQGQQRSVQISFVEQPYVAATLSSQGVAHVSPFILCPVKDYHYEIDNTPVILRCTASVQGFAQPTYTWKVNGTAATGGIISSTTTVAVDNPNDPKHPTTAMLKVQVDCTAPTDTSDYTGMSNELDVFSEDNQGHEQLQITVDVREKYASSDTVTALGMAILDTQELKYEQQYYDDLAKCEAEFERLLRLVEGKLAYNWIPIIFTLPDPPPDLYRSLQVLQQIVSDVQSVARTKPKLAGQIAQALGDLLHAPPALFGAQGTQTPTHSGAAPPAPESKSRTRARKKPV